MERKRSNTRRSIALFSTLIAVICMQGCQALSGSGPFSSSIQSEASRSNSPKAGEYRLIELSAETLRPYLRPAVPAPIPQTALLSVSAIRLVPGDSIKVTIADSANESALFATLAAGGTVFNNVRLDSSGTISLPYVGVLNASGKSLMELEQSIRGRVSKVSVEPQVRVELVGDLSGSVLVAGAVKSPGRFTTLQGPLTLLDAINSAGGPLIEPYLVNITVRNGASVRTYNYQDVLSGQNFPLEARSEIVVERARKRLVAMGAVAKPGLIDLPSQFPSLLEVLGTVGGLDGRSADPRGVFVFRLDQTDEKNPKAEVIRLDMREPAAIFLAGQFLIQPDDAVYVTNAAVYEWQKIISPIVQVLVLGGNLERF